MLPASQQQGFIIYAVFVIMAIVPWHYLTRVYRADLPDARATVLVRLSYIPNLADPLFTHIPSTTLGSRPR